MIPVPFSNTSAKALQNAASNARETLGGTFSSSFPFQAESFPCRASLARRCSRFSMAFHSFSKALIPDCRGIGFHAPFSLPGSSQSHRRFFYYSILPTLFLLFSGRCRQVPPMLLLDHAPAGIPNYGISYSSLSMTNMVHFEYKKT